MSAKTIRYILRHPLNRGQPVRTLLRYLSWQIKSRIQPGKIRVPFVNNTCLLVKRGMTGATGNVYCGLHEFQDMAFVLHALRAEDIFYDVGANIGSYTVLAAGAVGARVVAYEPAPTAYGHLQENVQANRCESLVQLRNMAIGSKHGRLHFTTGYDTMNHIVDRPSANQETVEVEATTLDTETTACMPTILKIDVEGHEQEVFHGAQATLRAPSLLAVLVEVSAVRNSPQTEDRTVHNQMLDLGFTPCWYEPFSRTLHQSTPPPRSSLNTLYIKDLPTIRHRLQSAPRFSVHGTRI